MGGNAEVAELEGAVGCEEDVCAWVVVRMMERGEKGRWRKRNTERANGKK